VKVTLKEAFDIIPDCRRAEGKRHSLSLILIITLMSMMSQGYTLRSIEAFVNRHRKALIKYLKVPKGRLPSLATIRRTLMQVDFMEVSKALKFWIVENGLIVENEWISIDGKCIKSSITDYNNQNQNFVSVVTAFVHNKHIALMSDMFESKKTSEVDVVERLISSLGLQGVTFTLDALHAKKNAKLDCSNQ
jgi:hypothetical protein